MSSFLSAELAATCNALGYYDTKSKKYYADSNTLETVKDLIRYLRKDDETHEIRRYLGESQVLQTDLLPLLKNYWEQTNLFDVLLRLLVNLTSPALMLWNEVIPTEKTARYYYLQIEDHQQKYKQAFADEKVWAVLSTRLSKILELDFAIRGDENNLIIERILILIRNILYIPSNPEEERRPDNDASIHDQVLWSLHQSGMLDIVLYIVSSTAEQAYYMHILEILSFMLREQSASELGSTALQRSHSERMRDEAELLLMRHHENNKKQEKLKKFCGARHSRFGGTYVIKSLQSISDKEYIYHKPLNNLDSVHFDVAKQKARTPKNRLPIQEVSSERRSVFSVKLILKEFCAEFLNGAYNTFMYHVKDNFARAKSQAHDESYYLWAIRFFMEFNRSNNFQVKLVSETVSVDTFHFVQQQMEAYYDYISVNKKQCRPWSKRLHIALLAYRELLLTVCAMDNSSDEGVRKSAKVMKSTIFYVMEYRELIITLLITFDELLFSHSYLNDLIETQHIFLKMLQQYCNKNEVVVQKQMKKRRRKKKNAVADVDVQNEASNNEPNLEELWNEAVPQLSVLLGSGLANIPDDIVPFDATSDTPINEQKTDAMKKIHQYLVDSEFENALGLLRASREVWPENDYFGSLNMAPEEELLILQDIFLSNLGGRTSKQLRAEQNQEEEEYYDEENEEMESMMERDEGSFKFSDFLNRLANRKVVKACAIALQNFESNDVRTNYCILKLLHRIVWDLKMATMVFQASLFRTFQRAFNLKDLPQFKDLIKFATYVLRQFFKLAEKNRKLFMETLFWKSSREAIEIEEGYGSYAEKSKAEANAWSEVQENELTTLFTEHQDNGIEEDIVDWICNNLVDHTRPRRAVLKKMKEMSLLSNYKKSTKGGSRSKAWSEEEERQLSEAYEHCKNNDNPIESICNTLPFSRARVRIIEKLLEMKLIQDKKEVMKKKRLRMSKQKGAHRDSESNVSDDDSDDSHNEQSSVQIIQKKKQAVPKNRMKKISKSKTKCIKKVNATRADIIKLLQKVIHMTDALEWLQESLSDIVEDRKENNEELDVDSEIPLVAIMEYSVTAMDHPDFQNLLRALQIREPADEQESHWRISNNLSISTLEGYCQLLSDAASNNLPETEEISETNEVPNNQSDSDDDDIFNRVKEMVTSDEGNRNIDLPSTSISFMDSNINVPDTNVDDDENKENQPYRPPKLNKRALIDSDEDDYDEISTTHNDNKRERDSSDIDSPLKRKKRSRLVISDDESS